MKRNLAGLFASKFNKKVTEITELKPHSSNRRIFRIRANNFSCMGIYNSNIKENTAFINFARTFRKLNLNVPEIYTKSRNRRYYLLEDLGDETLYDFIGKNRNMPGKLLRYYKLALDDLIKFQLRGKERINFNYCYQTAVFGKKQIKADLKKFEVNFLSGKIKSRYQLHFKDILTDYFINIINSLEDYYFMYRDFQPRNMMIKNNSIYYIDFQSGRKGPLQYDLASFLYSGSIILGERTRNYLLHYYIKKVSGVTDYRSFTDNFYAIALIRIIQMLGSYSYNYRLKKEAIFKTKIKNALENLRKISRKINDEKIKLFLKELSDACE